MDHIVLHPIQNCNNSIIKEFDPSESVVRRIPLSYNWSDDYEVTKNKLMDS